MASRSSKSGDTSEKTPKKGYQATMKAKSTKRKRWKAAVKRNVEMMEEAQKTHQSSIQNRVKMLKAKAKAQAKTKKKTTVKKKPKMAKK